MGSLLMAVFQYNTFSIARNSDTVQLVTETMRTSLHQLKKSWSQVTFRLESTHSS
jgi:hypothetical protein